MYCRRALGKNPTWSQKLVIEMILLHIEEMQYRCNKGSEYIHNVFSFLFFVFIINLFFSPI